MKQLYTYVGPIFVFDNVITPKWSATTWAVSKKQAKNNFLFRAKQALGYSAGAKLTLSENLIQVKEV